MKVSELITQLTEFKEKHGDLPMRMECDECGMSVIDRVEPRTVLNPWDVLITDVCGLMMTPFEWTEGPIPEIEDPMPKVEKSFIECHNLLQRWNMAFKNYIVIANKWDAGKLANDTMDYLDKLKGKD